MAYIIVSNSQLVKSNPAQAEMMVNLSSSMTIRSNALAYESLGPVNGRRGQASVLQRQHWIEIKSSIVWTGSEYTIGWNDDRFRDVEIFVSRVDAEGNVLASEVLISDTP